MVFFVLFAFLISYSRTVKCSTKTETDISTSHQFMGLEDPRLCLGYVQSSWNNLFAILHIINYMPSQDALKLSGDIEMVMKSSVDLYT